MPGRGTAVNGCRVLLTAQLTAGNFDDVAPRDTGVAKQGDFFAKHVGIGRDKKTDSISLLLIVEKSRNGGISQSLYDS